MTRYLSGLCVAGLGLCGGGWLIVMAAASDGESGGAAGQANLVTGAFLVVVSAACLACWAVAWRRRLQADGILPVRFLLVSRRAAWRNRRRLHRDAQRADWLERRSARTSAVAPPPRQAAAAYQADDELPDELPDEVADEVADAEEAWW